MPVSGPGPTPCQKRGLVVPEGSDLVLKAEVLGDILVSSCEVPELPSARMPLGSDPSWTPAPMSQLGTNGPQSHRALQ